MYTVITLITGIALLIGGIFVMRYGLKQMLWNKLQRLLRQLTVTPLRGMIVGTIAAAVMQSSTALSLITIGLVSAEYLTFYQALGIILGANIGTCSTVQLMTLSMPDRYFLPLFICALLVSVVVRRFRYPALAAAGLFSMFLGLTTVSDALSTLPELGIVLQYLAAAKANPLYGILGGMIITLLFQSSSAATGVLMLLAQDGLVDLTTAAYVVYGNNIGSCLSSVIIGAAAPVAAKRVAVSHIVLNLLGVAIFLPLTSPLITITTYLAPDFAGQVAMLHTLFNIISSIMVLPVINHYAKLIMVLVPGRRRR